MGALASQEGVKWIREYLRLHIRPTMELKQMEENLRLVFQNTHEELIRIAKRNKLDYGTTAVLTLFNPSTSKLVHITFIFFFFFFFSIKTHQLNPLFSLFFFSCSYPFHL
jgi:predicted PurR-regulated permease PerM